jgi:hypothetical protein
MRAYKIIGLSIATLAAVTAAVSPAAARPHHRHQVCHVEHHGHHATRVCHWVR